MLSQNKQHKITNLKLIISFAAFIMFLAYFTACNKTEYGVGPIKDEIKLAAVDENLAVKGKSIFDVKCVACHKIDSRLVGPMLKDVTKRRRPEWIMNQILNPQEMTQKDPTAKELLSQYLIQMTFQDVTQDDARAILEYFRAIDENKLTEK